MDAIASTGPPSQRSVRAVVDLAERGRECLAEPARRHQKRELDALAGTHVLEVVELVDQSECPFIAPAKHDPII